MTNISIPFIQLKVAQIGTALFNCGSQSQLAFSTYIITALKIDDEGNVWFFVNKGVEAAEKNANPFTAQLEFYRKGFPFFMRIEGEGSIVHAQEKIHDLMGKGIHLQQEALAGILLVKVKIENVVYKELKQQKPFNFISGITAKIKNLLHPVLNDWNVAYRF